MIGLKNSNFEEKNIASKNIAFLKKYNIRSVENYASMPTKNNTKPFSVKKIFELAIRSYAVCRFAEYKEATFGEFETFWTKTWNSMVKLYDFEKILTTNDIQHLKDIITEEDDECEHLMNAETTAVCLWVLGVVPFPSLEKRVDFRKIEQLLGFDLTEKTGFNPVVYMIATRNLTTPFSLSNFKMVSYEEVLEKADLLKRIDIAYDLQRIEQENLDDKNGTCLLTETSFPFDMEIVGKLLEALEEILNWSIKG